MSAKPLLDQSCRDSQTWQIVQAYLEARIQQLRVSNDNDKDAIETANIRGRIAELKLLLAKAVPSPEPVVNDG